MKARDQSKTLLGFLFEQTGGTESAQLSGAETKVRGETSQENEPSGKLPAGKPVLDQTRVRGENAYERITQERIKDFVTLVRGETTTEG